MRDFTLAESKLEMLISGYRVNADDSTWLRSLISASPRAPAPDAAPAGEPLSQHDQSIIHNLEALTADKSLQFWPQMLALGALRIIRQLEAAAAPASEPATSEALAPLKAANLSAALRAIVRECRGPELPFSTDSYLPPHLLDLAVAALESTETQEHETPLQVIEAMRRDEGVDDEFVANLSPRRLRILARDGDEELS